MPGTPTASKRRQRDTDFGRPVRPLPQARGKTASAKHHRHCDPGTPRRRAGRHRLLYESAPAPTRSSRSTSRTWTQEIFVAAWRTASLRWTAQGGHGGCNTLMKLVEETFAEILAALTSPA